MKSIARLALVTLIFSTGLVAAQTLEQANEAYGRQDYTTAFLWIKRLAEAGSAQAQFQLGGLYAQGHGAPKDDRKAAIWLRKAAEQKDVEAQIGLAILYFHGEGVPKDYALSFEWMRRAAEQGNAYAQVSLGSLYDNGTGVAKDSQQAAVWYRRAADQGNAKAQFLLGMKFQMDRDYPLSALWIAKAAEQGYPDAQAILGSLYASGTGVAKDYPSAYFWTLLATTNNQMQVAEVRDLASTFLTPQQRAKVQADVAAWKPRKPGL